MRPFANLFAVIALCFLAGRASKALWDPPEPSWTTRGEVIAVHDGDTLTIRVTRDIRVRLLDAWAPEVKADNRLPESQRSAEKAAGIKSRDALTALALGKPVILQVPTSEDLLKSTTMGRVLGRVWLEGDDESLSEKQVKAGNATREKRAELK